MRAASGPKGKYVGRIPLDLSSSSTNFLTSAVWKDTDRDRGRSLREARTRDGCRQCRRTMQPLRREIFSVTTSDNEPSRSNAKTSYAQKMSSGMPQWIDLKE